MDLLSTSDAFKMLETQAISLILLKATFSMTIKYHSLQPPNGMITVIKLIMNHAHILILDIDLINADG